MAAETLHPNIPRRKNRPSRNLGGSELPKSAGGYVLQQLRPRLPLAWQYGWRWKCVQGAWLVIGGMFLVKLAHTMFFSMSEDDIRAKAAKYTYVRNDQGEVVDISYKPLIDAGVRAQKRAAKYLQEEDDGGDAA